MNNRKRIIAIVTFLILSFLLIAYGASRGEAKLNVTFVDSYNDKVIDSQVIKSGESAQIPSDPEHKDFVFVGWYIYGSNDTLVTNFKNLKKDLKVEARYKADKNNNKIADDKDTYYDVKFIDGMNNELLKTEKVLVGLSASAPSVRIYDNYTFSGWNKEYSNIQSDLEVVAIYTRTNTTQNQNYTPENPTVPVVEEKTYILNFYNKEKELIDTQKVKEGNTGGVVDVPEYEGYTFEGWYLETDKEYIIGSKVNSDMEIYGKWTLTNYQVKFNTKDGSFVNNGELSESQTLDHGTEITMPGAKKNYTLTYHENGSKAEVVGFDKLVLPAEFLGWCETDSESCENLIAPETKITIEDDVVYYAVWGKTKDIYLTTALRLPSKSIVYEFAGWSTDIESEKKYDAFEKINLTSNLDLYAVWKETLRKYEVIFAGKLNNDNNPDNLKLEQKIENGKEIVLPEGETKNFTLTYDANGGSLSEEVSTVTLNVPFKGWCKNDIFCSDSKLLKALDKDIITGYSLYVPYYNNSSEGTVLVSATPKLDENYTYNFLGWSLSKNAKVADPKYNAGKEIKLKSNLKLYAVYSKTAIPMYTITFDANEGTLEPSSYNLRLGSVMNELPEPSRTYILTYNEDGGTLLTENPTTTAKAKFLGWCEGTSGDCVTTVSSITVTGNQTYTAKWGQSEEGIELADITKTKGMENEYTFLGWSDGSETLKEIGDTIYLSNDLTLNAIWSLNKYTIIFKDGETELTELTINQEYNTDIVAPNDLVKEGYTFVGWDKPIPEKMPAENLTINAVWEINQYTVEFWHKVLVPIQWRVGTTTVSHGNTISLDQVPDVQLPVFDGYKVILRTEDGTEWDLSKNVVKSDMKLYYDLKLKTYTLQFNFVNGTSNPIYVNHGGSITAPENTLKQGHTCEWNRYSYNFIYITKDDIITETCNKNSYKVKINNIYDDILGIIKISDEFTLEYEATKNIPNPTRRGYNFAGWTLTGDGSSMEGTTFKMGHVNATLTAKWTSK